MVGDFSFQRGSDPFLHPGTGNRLFLFQRGVDPSTLFEDLGNAGDADRRDLLLLARCQVTIPTCVTHPGTLARFAAVRCAASCQIHCLPWRFELTPARRRALKSVVEVKLEASASTSISLAGRGPLISWARKKAIACFTLVA